MLSWSKSSNFFQKLTKKLQLFSKADIFVFPPSEPEGHPWVLVEAMAASLPIIATNQGAISESVIDGQNGYITSGEPVDIANKISLLFNDDIRLRLGKNSNLIYKQKFTEETLVKNLLEVFNNV